VQLEFGLRVHFALWPLARTESKLGQLQLQCRLEHFRRYLETRGSELSRRPEYLVYYGLPYVAEPHTHPSFQHLFAPECAAEQRKQLETFLRMLPSGCKVFSCTKVTQANCRYTCRSLRFFKVCKYWTPPLITGFFPSICSASYISCSARVNSLRHVISALIYPQYRRIQGA
jgi:hypothetical protein